VLQYYLFTRRLTRIFEVEVPIAKIWDQTARRRYLDAVYKQPFDQKVPILLRCSWERRTDGHWAYMVRIIREGTVLNDFFSFNHLCRLSTGKLEIAQSILGWGM